MERSGDDNKSVNYLDINISINTSGHVTTKLYNKLDEFNFPVVMYRLSTPIIVTDNYLR